MSITLSALQKQRTDTAANWTSANPTLLAGEIGIESDTGYWKVGDGSTVWNSLGYLGVIPSSGTYPLSQLIMPLGTAGAPPLTFVGDLNTGIYSPGADQVAISTAGSGRLFVDASGNIGINTASPQNYGAGYTPLTIDASTSPSIELRVAGTRYGRIYASTSSLNLDTWAATPMIFGINTDEKMRLTSTGLGVGTSTPAVALDVYGAINLRSQYNLTWGGAYGANIPTIVGDSSAAYLAIYPAGSTSGEKVRIDSSGRLGIGNSAPQYPLQTDTAGTGTAVGDNTAIYVQSQASGRDCNIRFGDSVNASARVGYLSNNLYFYVNGSERLRIDSSGNVGIGTTTVNSLLEVRGTTDGQNVLHLSNSAGSTDGGAENQIRVTCNGNTHWGNLDIQAFQTIFTQNGGEKARIDSSGRLLVGTSTARSNLYNNSSGVAPQVQLEGTALYLVNDAGS
jgi:hypothetical protein